MKRALDIWMKGFVLWVLLSAALAYRFPAAFEWFKPLIVPGLMAIMLGMGMTLVPGDFTRVLRAPRAVICGVAGQFLIMPLLGALLAKAGGLSKEASLGFIIVGACPAGTASNFLAYMARADLSLSITLTACTTALAVVLTPLLIVLLGDTYVEVDRAGLFISVLQMVLVPVVLGLILRWLLGPRVGRALDVFRAASVLVIALIVGCIVALSRAQLGSAIGLIGALVVAHNVLGLALGYGFATLFRLPLNARRSIALEVGMQNSALGVALASTHFTSSLVALPSTVFSVVHNVTGSAVAAWWRRSSPSAMANAPTGKQTGAPERP